MLRRDAILLPLACALAPVTFAATLPPAVALDKELGRALESGRPLVLMSSLPGCPYCRVVRDSYLAPLAADTGQPIVQVDLGSARRVADFDGRMTTHEELVQRWTIKAAPTVLFFGRRGLEAAPRLVGASIPDFYGAYLQARLDTAVDAVRHR